MNERCEARAFGKHQCVYLKGHSDEHRDSTGLSWHDSKSVVAIADSTTLTTPSRFSVERTYTQAELDSAVQAARSAARQEGADECNRLHAATHDAVEADFARQLAGARADEAKWWIEYGFYDDAPSDMGRERLAKLEAEAQAHFLPAPEPPCVDCRSRKE